MNYARFGSIMAVDGKQKELAAILLQASQLLVQNSECIKYSVGLGEDPNSVWVYEEWASKAAHKASLQMAEIQALITEGMPMIAGMGSQTEINILPDKAE